MEPGAPPCAHSSPGRVWAKRYNTVVIERFILRRTRHKQMIVGGIVMLLVLLMPQVAQAHVVVLPVTVPTATSQVFTIRVPTEKETPTISVRIEFPPELVVARFEPMPGWTRAADRDGAGRIVAATWSGGSIAADEYQDFVFLGRTPREPGVLVFPAYQTYEGGEIVAWADAPDQDHPAPTVEVVAAAAPVVETDTHMESETSAANPPVADVATADAVAGTPTMSVAALATQAPTVAPAAQDPQLVAGAAEANTGGSDLPLIVAIGAFVLALVAVALAAVAVARRPAAS